VGQQETLSSAEGIFLSGSEANLFAGADGGKIPSGASRMRSLG